MSSAHALLIHAGLVFAKHDAMGSIVRASRGRAKIYDEGTQEKNAPLKGYHPIERAVLLFV